VCDSTPVQTTALRGLMASLALTGASLWRAMSMRDRPAGCASCASRLCGALRGSGRPLRGGRRRSFVGGDRLLVANGRCWRAPRRRRRRRATARQRATNTTLAATRQRERPTRHSPPHGDIDAADVAAAAAGRAARTLLGSRSVYSNGDVQEWHIGDYGAIYYDGFREHENGLEHKAIRGIRR